MYSFLKVNVYILIFIYCVLYSESCPLTKTSPNYMSGNNNEDKREMSIFSGKTDFKYNTGLIIQGKIYARPNSFGIIEYRITNFQDPINNQLNLTFTFPNFSCTYMMQYIYVDSVVQRANIGYLFGRNFNSVKGTWGISVGNRDGGGIQVGEFINDTCASFPISPLIVNYPEIVVYDLDRIINITNITAPVWKPAITDVMFGESTVTIIGFRFLLPTIMVGEYNCTNGFVNDSMIVCSPPRDIYFSNKNQFAVTMTSSKGNGSGSVALGSLLSFIARPYYVNLSGLILNPLRSLLLYGNAAQPSNIQSYNSSQVDFRFSLDAQCGYSYLVNNTFRQSSSLLVCPLPQLLSWTPSALITGGEINVTGHFMHTKMYNSTETGASFYTRYANGTTHPCDTKFYMDPVQSVYYFKCNILPGNDSFTFVGKTITNQTIEQVIRYNPFIESISNTTYNQTGQVTIIGTSFLDSNTTITIGNSSCTDIKVLSNSTRIICTFKSDIDNDYNDHPLPVFISIEDKYNTTSNIFYYNHRERPTMRPIETDTPETPQEILPTTSPASLKENLQKWKTPVIAVCSIVGVAMIIGTGFIIKRYHDNQKVDLKLHLTD
ncbi:hypothetical protein CYY_008884 [Polysphondylium violaceum]|uniref:IPT/TIG domain-containing protein n=1 Tax=Polysphondylium violaceum TaxID=133409 RepID=A0A8J4PMQ4_9MYCE|nr:hypothetical protein CYY_008884 [Polysphondylium violaceum]